MSVDSTSSKPKWQQICEEKQERLKKAVPEAWRVEADASIINPRIYLEGDKVGHILSDDELAITKCDAVEILSQIHSGKVTSEFVTTAFCKRAAVAYAVTNPLCEIFFDEGIARAKELDKYFKETGKVVGPLHGLPISVKDHIDVQGKDTNMGLTAWYGNVAEQHAASVQILYDAGAVLYCKTSMPQAGMANETVSPIHGTTKCAYNTLLTSGGSSGGEGSLIGMFGSPMGVGTDIAGSIRSPASYNGIYGFKPSERRLPLLGERTTDSGNVGILVSLGPIARSLRDCELFMRVMLNAEPWNVDPAVLRMPWRFNEENIPEKLTIGVVRWDHFVMPHPPISRALDIAVDTLRKAGHEVIEWEAKEHGLPSGDVILPLFYPNGARHVFDLIDGMDEPWIGPIRRGMKDNPVVQKLRESNQIEDYWKAVVERDQFRVDYARRWNESVKLTASGRKLDAIISPTATSVSFPHDFNRWSGYTHIWNLLDYPTSVVGVTHADSKVDTWDYQPDRNNERDVANWEIYKDPSLYDGCPVAIGISGRTGEDEKTLKMTMVIDDLLKRAGHGLKK
ncbi:amidase signature domain-containing protein [Fusarium oxysporum]|nr:amidase signature domain-containing protein [Fusarium oxysporum]